MLELGVALALLFALLAAMFGSERLYAGGVRRVPRQVTGPVEGGHGDGKVWDTSTV